MRKSSKLLIVASLAFLVVLVTASSMVIAYSTQTNECGTSGCHDTSSLTVTSNATGTVNADLGVPFTLTIDSSGYTRGDTDFYIVIEPTWADNNQFSYPYTYVQDNSGDDDNSDINAISISVEFTPKSAGTHTIRIWSAGRSDVATSLDVSVSVADDTTFPVIDSPADKVVSEGDIAESVTWNPTDVNPDRYVIFDNEVSWLTGEWDGSAIVIDLDTLTLGLHNLTCAVYDIADNMASDQVDVTVIDDTPPVITPLIDQDISEGSSTPLTWTVSDLHPGTYEIWRNDVSIASGAWDGSDISTSLSALTLGLYNFTLVLTDTSTNSATSQVNITIVDGTAPLVDNPPDIQYFQGQTGFTIVWTPSDTHPSSYEVLQNGSSIQQGDWNSTGESVSINVDGLSIGTHNFTFIAYDIGNNYIADEVIVTVFSAVIPFLNHPNDMLISEGTLGTELSWTPFDLNPASYEIYRDGSLIKSGAWNTSGEVMSILLEGYTLGVYNFTIFVIDTDTNNATDTVWVTFFDGTLPLINSPNNISYDEGETGYEIIWTPSDLHPQSYTIYRDGIEIQSGLWNSSSEIFTLQVGGLSFGDYKFTIGVLDIGGNLVTDEVEVFVLDGTSPILNNPADFGYEQSTTGNIITWVASDLNPVSYSIYRNDILVISGGWDGTSISIGVDWLIPGVYNYRLEVTDAGGNVASDMVLVTVTAPSTPPETSTTSTTTTSEVTTTSTIPVEPIIPPAVATPLSLVVGTWVVIIVAVLVISEILIRKGKW